MVRKASPILAVGAVVLAAITAYILDMPFRKDPLSLSLMVGYFLLEIALVWFVAALVRRKRMHEWYPAQGTIESCNAGSYDKGIQTYCCGYVFRPDDTRQGGIFVISEQSADSEHRLDEIRKELIGRIVRVRYDPKDFTRCMVEDKEVAKWQVEND